MSKQQETNTFKEDGIRPIENSDLNVVNTFEEDGKRPIAESPDFLVSDRNIPNSQSSLDQEQDSVIQVKQEDHLDTAKIREIDSQRPVDNSEVKVADTFEEDGKRPIMENKYHVVDTLDIDGKRPITYKN